MTDQGPKSVSQSFRDFDYFDFGCSSGANIQFLKDLFPARSGLGIDIDAAKIALAVQSGHQAVVQDILELPEEKIVRFVTMSHFLEHLDNVAMAQKMLAKAISVSHDFVFVRQPWFDSDGYLFLLGYKFYWSHWRGHRNKMSALDFHSILSAELSKGRISGFSIYGRSRVKSGKDSTLLPLAAPVDQHHYKEPLHGPKDASRDIEIPTFKEIVACIEIGDSSGMDSIMAKLGHSELIYSSRTAG